MRKRSLRGQRLARAPPPKKAIAAGGRRGQAVSGTGSVVHRRPNPSRMAWNTPFGCFRDCHRVAAADRPGPACWKIEMVDAWGRGKPMRPSFRPNRLGGRLPEDQRFLQKASGQVVGICHWRERLRSGPVAGIDPVWGPCPEFSWARSATPVDAIRGKLVALERVGPPNRRSGSPPQFTAPWRQFGRPNPGAAGPRRPNERIWRTRMLELVSVAHEKTGASGRRQNARPGPTALACRRSTAAQRTGPDRLAGRQQPRPSTL